MLPKQLLLLLLVDFESKDVKERSHTLELLVVARVEQIRHAHVIVLALHLLRIQPEDAIMEQGLRQASGRVPVLDALDDTVFEVAFFQLKDGFEDCFLADLLLAHGFLVYVGQVEVLVRLGHPLHLRCPVFQAEHLAALMGGVAHIRSLLLGSAGIGHTRVELVLGGEIEGPDEEGAGADVVEGQRVGFEDLGQIAESVRERRPLDVHVDDREARVAHFKVDCHGASLAAAMPANAGRDIHSGARRCFHVFDEGLADEQCSHGGVACIGDDTDVSVFAVGVRLL